MSGASVRSVRPFAGGVAVGLALAVGALYALSTSLKADTPAPFHRIPTGDVVQEPVLLQSVDPVTEARLQLVRNTCTKLQAKTEYPYINVHGNDISNYVTGDIDKQVIYSLDPTDLETLLVEEKHGVIYCAAAKVGSTSWKYVLSSLQTGIPLERLRPNGSIHHFDVLDKFDINPLSEYPRAAVGRIWEYPKFMFVRHPFERLVSAYKNKFASNNVQFHKWFGKKIIRGYRENPTEEAAGTGKGVTFEEFLQFVCDKPDSNEHWKPIAKLCLACSVTYDFIGHLETSTDDMPKVLHSFFPDQLAKIPHRNKQHSIEGAAGYKFEYPSYFKNIHGKIISRLLKIYKLDLELFGYTYKTT